MSDLLDSLSRIENAAKAISSQADEEKQKIGQEFKQKTIEFDDLLNSQTEKKLASLQANYEEEVLEEQTKLQKQQDDELIRLNTYYKEHHDNIVEQLFQKVISTDL